MRDRIINGVSMLLGNGKIYDTSRYRNVFEGKPNNINNIMLEQQINPTQELLKNNMSSDTKPTQDLVKNYLNNMPDFIQNKEVTENLCKTAYSSLGKDNIFAPYCCDKYNICK